MSRLLIDDREQHWFWINNATLDMWLPALGVHAWAVYCYIVRRANKIGTCWPSYQTIARETGMSRPTAVKSVAQLQRAGLLVVERRMDEESGDQTSNLYRVRGGVPRLPPGQDTESRSDTPDTTVVNEVDTKKTHRNQTQEEEIPDPTQRKAAFAWAGIREARPELPDDLLPLSLSDGVLVLRAPTTTAARRWADRLAYDGTALARLAPVPLTGIEVCAPGIPALIKP